METKVLMYILGMLSEKDGGSDAVYRDEALARQILDYIRSEKLVETMERAGITERRLPGYLNMRLAMFRGKSVESCLYFFRNRAVLAELHRLAEYYRTAPEAERPLGKLRIRETASRLGNSPTDRETVYEALRHAGYAD